MPTYEYACKACGEHLEAVQSFTDDPLTTCPKCGGPLRKVYGNIAIAFKGSGFYKTDNRSMGNRGTERPGAAETKSDSDSKSDAGKESTPAAASADPPTSNGSGSTPSKTEKADKPAKADKSPATT